MPASKQIRKCARCGHPRNRHTIGNLGVCTKKVPVAWRGNGRGGTPVIGYCKCPGYIDKDDK